jgi:hypothetical protein
MDGDSWCRGKDVSGVGGCGGSNGGCGDGGSGGGGDSVDVGRGDNNGSGDSYSNGDSESGNSDSGDEDSNSNSGGGDSDSGEKNNNQLKAAVEKAATVAAAEASVAAATVLTLVAMCGGGGYGNPPHNITKWSLGAGGAISLRFFCDKLTNLGRLTLRLILTVNKNFFCVFSCSSYVGFVPVSNLLDINWSIWWGEFLSKFLLVTDPKPSFGWRVFGGPRSPKTF